MSAFFRNRLEYPAQETPHTDDDTDKAQPWELEVCARNVGPEIHKANDTDGHSECHHKRVVGHAWQMDASASVSVFLYRCRRVSLLSAFIVEQFRVLRVPKVVNRFHLRNASEIVGRWR